MLTHTIIAGLIPTDGIKVQKALDEASAQGYVFISSTCCALDEFNAYYIATMGLPVAEPPAKRGGIGLGGGGRNTMSATDVSKSPAAPPPDSKASS